MSKTAVIWGASGGIGQALVRQLTEEGWQVAAIARNVDKLAGLTDIQLEADVSNPFAVQQAAYNLALEIEEASLWIYTVGSILGAPVEEMSAENWQAIINANLTGAFLATHHSLPSLTSDAHLMYVGAVSERLRLPKISAYVAAKAGLEAFVEVVRKEQRKRRVTLVRPGAVATPFWETAPFKLPKNAASPEKVATKMIAAHNEGHSGTLELN